MGENQDKAKTEAQLTEKGVETQNQTESTTATKNLTAIIDDDKNTALHYSAAEGDEEAVKTAIAKDQKIDAENYLGWTPLMMAVRNGHVAVTKLLIKHKADASRRNKYDINVFVMSIASGNLALINFLLNHLLAGGVSKQSIQRLFSPMSMAVLFYEPKIIDFLHKMSFDVNLKTNITGITPLMFASAIRSEELKTLLLKKRADSSAVNCLGLTASDQEKQRNEISLKYMENMSDTNNLLQAEELRIKDQSKYCLQQQVPVILISPHIQQPFIHYQNVGFHGQRKSSDAMSPQGCMTPNLTPITPVGVYPQYFFPPGFSTNNTYYNNTSLPVSPFHHPLTLNPYMYDSNVLNMRLSPSYIPPLMSPNNYTHQNTQCKT